MHRNKGRIFLLILMTIMLLISVATAQESGTAQSSQASIGQGKLMTWDSIVKNNIGMSNKNVMPIGYEIDKEKLNELKKKPIAPSEKMGPRVERDKSVPILKPSISTSSLNLLFSLESLDDLANTGHFVYAPPDPNIAAGPNHAGVVVNDALAFYKKDGTLVKEATLQDWFRNVCKSCSIITDPRIIYDQNEGHWVVVVLGLNFALKGGYLVAVSQTSDPTGNWWNYFLDGSLSIVQGKNKIQTFPDYPDLGMDGISSTNGGAIYITSNQYGTNNQLFYTSLLNILPKSALYTGGGLTAGSNYWKVYGSILQNSDFSQAFTLRTAQTSGNPGGEFLINDKSDGGNYITIWKVIPTYPPNAPNVVRQATINIGAYSPPPNAVQPGCTDTLETLDNRMYNAVYRNDNLYTAFTEAHNWGNGTVAAIRYLDINTISNTATLNQTYGADQLYYWFPTITTDSSNNIIFVFARSNSSEYAGIHYTGRKTTDTEAQPSTPLKTGSFCITGGPMDKINGGNRWGDYFGIGNDPDGNKVWLYGEWPKNLGIDNGQTIWNWGTYIGEVSN